MLILVIITLLGYLLFSLYIVLGWKKLILPISNKHFLAPKDQAYFSVVVSLRNEAKNIPQLFQSFASQSYKNFEIICIDDHSTDNTFQLLRQQINHYPLLNISVIKNDLLPPNSVNYKKNAIKKAISQARGKYIIATDADCTFSKDWIMSFALHYKKHKSLLISGAVKFKTEKSFFNRLLKVEFSSLILSGAASIGWKLPTMCNGANISYTKKAYISLNDKEKKDHVASGDDEFLMHSLHKKSPDKISFLNHPNAIVTTQAPGSIHEFYHQRKRWAGKWKHYTHLPSSILAVFVAFLNISILYIYTYSLLIESNLLPLAIFTFFLKLLFDIGMLHIISSFLEEKIDLLAIFVLQIIYPPYLLFFGLRSQFGRYRWKSRILK